MNGARLRGRRNSVAGLLVLLLASTCRQTEPPPPALADAAASRGGPASRARAYLSVTVAGREAERRRAAFLWGLYACDGAAPASALTAFAIAAPEGGRAHLAARRLAEALRTASLGAGDWERAGRTGWLPVDERSRLLVRGAEALADRRDMAGATRLANLAVDARGDDRARRLAVLARCGSAAAERELAAEFPTRFGELVPGRSLAAVTASFSTAEWASQARAWLDAGVAPAALAAAARGGGQAVLTAARAALRLRRSVDAATWAARAGDGNPEGWLERADAYRQIAWGGDERARTRNFEEMLRCAARARALLPPGSPLTARAELQAGEALLELGRLRDAAAHLADGAVRREPRYDWVLRRYFLREATTGAPPDARVEPVFGQTNRVRRIGVYWRGRSAARGGDRRPLERLEAGGFPDLPAWWSARAVAGAVSVVPSGDPLEVPAPPAWAGDLLAVGRVADVIVAWRFDLEAERTEGAAWLSLLSLAEMPPIEAIPLLVRGEPRLAAGPWSGLPRELLQRYLPLPWRTEVEQAARRAGVPPWLLAGLVRQESAWNPNARSAAGAVGLAQVLPAVAGELVRRERLPASWARSLSEPGPNLGIGALLLARWRASLGGSWTAALACYNAGERRVRETWERAGRADGPEFVEAIEIPETWDYVHRVALFAEGYRVTYWPEGRPYPWT